MEEDEEAIVMAGLDGIQSGALRRVDREISVSGQQQKDSRDRLVGRLTDLL